MNILFVFSRHSKDPKESTLTKDLAEAFRDSGDNVYVVTMNERKNKFPTELNLEYGINVLRVKTGNYFSVNKLEKIITIITFPFLMKRQIKKYLGEIKFDLILTHTPFMSSASLIKPIKKLYDCPAHLLLWDIFPQNAKDIGILTNPIIFKILKYFEIKMLCTYDKIWCMSEGNVSYIKKNYPMLKKNVVNKLYNGAKLQTELKIDKSHERSMRGFLADDFIAIFGGNMGLPQCLENLLNLAKNAQKIPNSKFLFVGSGTETNRIQKLANQMCLENVIFYPQLSRDEYKILIAISDIGLISLDQRFTVPNFPSKTTDYFCVGLPILASLDDCSANDYGYFITDIVKAGIFAKAADELDLFSKYRYLHDNPKVCAEMSANIQHFYKSELDITKHVTIIKNELPL